MTRMAGLQNGIDKICRGSTGPTWPPSKSTLRRNIAGRRTLLPAEVPAAFSLHGHDVWIENAMGELLLEGVIDNLVVSGNDLQ